MHRSSLVFVPLAAVVLSACSFSIGDVPVDVDLGSGAEVQRAACAAVPEAEITPNTPVVSAATMALDGDEMVISWERSPASADLSYAVFLYTDDLILISADETSPPSRYSNHISFSKASGKNVFRDIPAPVLDEESVTVRIPAKVFPGRKLPTTPFDWSTSVYIESDGREDQQLYRCPDTESGPDLTYR